MSASIASRFVQYGVPARPSIGGIDGTVPVAITMPRVASNSRSPAITVRGPVMVPRSRRNVTPFFTSRSTATWSFQLSVASSRIRWATGAQSGCTVAVPAIPSTRRVSATRLAARIIILLGTQPQ